jgi:hypothetical protein
MEKFNIEVEGIKYLVQPNADGTFGLLSKGVEVLRLKLNVGAVHQFKWESEDGYKNELIDKFGSAIENHSL